MLQKYDKQGMYQIYDRWPQIAKKSFESELEPIDLKDIDHIIFAGMGGSGALGDLFSAILSKTDVHVNVVKGYRLPNTVDSDTLVVTTSISGNTVETLSILDSARKTNCKVIGFSSGGKMEKICQKNNIQFRKIPMHHSPRASFTAFLYSILKTLGSVIPIKNDEISESIRELENFQKLISTSNLNKNNSSLNLAEWIDGIPMIYYPWGLRAAAIRFKSSLQENAKIHAISENVLEACHNGIVAWERKSNVNPILLEGQDDYDKTKERWLILKNYFQENNIDYKEVISTNGSILTKLISLIYQLDFATIYKAVLNETDPSPVRSIDYIKRKL